MLLSLFFALQIKPSDIGYKGVATDPDKVFESILNQVYMWTGIIAVIVLIFAGYLFVTSRGNPEQMKRSKDAVRGAVIGLIVVILAFTITQFILGGLEVK